MKIILQQLLSAAQEDKDLYQELQKAGEWSLCGYHPRMRACNEKNAALLEHFLQHHGWPFPSQYGQAAHDAAWWIAIHAISIPQVQKLALTFLEKGLTQQEPIAPDYARLYDKISLFSFGTQKYGTQLFPTPTGWQALHVVEPDTVNIRRASVNLPTLEDTLAEERSYSNGIISQEEAQDAEHRSLQFLKETGWR